MATIQKYKTDSGYRWRVRYRLNGKQKSVTKKTAKDARDFKARLEHQMREGSYIEPVKMTVGELLDAWLLVHKKKIALNTISGYEDWIKSVKIYIKDVFITRLTAADVEDMLAKYKASPYKKKTEHSARSALSLYQVMNLALKHAVKSRLLTYNVCDAVERPKQAKPDIQIIDAKDIPNYLDALKDTWAFPALALAMFCGMRRGEIFALDWKHIDYAKKELFVEFSHVVKTKTNVVDGKKVKSYIFEEKPPKNGKTRTIPLPDNVAEILKEHRKKQLAQRLLMGSQYHTKCQYSGKKNDFVLTMDDGKRPSPDYISTFFTRRQESAKIAKVSFHSLKHTAASILYVVLKGDYKQMSYILGHSSVKFTMDTYVHLFEEQIRLSKDKISEHIAKFFKV